MRIETEHVNPPIPIRKWDWIAYDRDDAPCFDYAHCNCHKRIPYGYGPTEEQAIITFVQDLLEKREVPMPIDECADQLERMLRDAYDASANT